MKILTLFLTFFLFFSPVIAKEFRIDFSDEGMKLFKKKGFGKKTVYTNGKDDKGYYLKAVADSGATGIGIEIENKELLKEMPFLNVTFKIEQDFTSIDQTTKDGHDWAARVMIGHGKKFGSKLYNIWRIIKNKKNIIYNNINNS